MAVTGLIIPEKPIRLGDCELNAAAFEVRRGKRTSKLERIPLQILLILIEERGKLVSREVIAERVWGKDVFVDVDNGINTAIRKIRQVLNDDTQQPRFIETISGMGYRFIGPVDEPEEDVSAVDAKEIPASVAEVVDEPDPQVKHRWGRIAGVAAALMLVSGIATVVWLKYWRPQVHEIHSIAVLPLQNLSGDSSQEFLADGMTEELITELSRIEPLRVISHTSVMDYKGTKKHLPEIARELNVDAILEGSVIREKEDVRVTVQLLDGPADRHLWSEAYERPLNGVLNLQRDVAKAVANEIRVKLTPVQQARLKAVQDLNPQAYENYVHGRYLLSTQFTMRAPLMQAKSHFENAIQADPRFAEAYSGLADAHLYLALGRYEVPETAFRLAHEALNKATELDDTVGEIHDTLGIILWRHDWDFAGAEKAFDRSIAMAPSYSCAHEDRAGYLAFLGKRSEALAELAKVNGLDLGPGAQMTAAAVFYQLRDYPRLIEVSKEGVATNPNEALEHLDLGIGYEGIGKHAEAIAEIKKADELSKGDQDNASFLLYSLIRSGDRLGAMKILQEWEKKESVNSYLMATMYSSIGLKDKAFKLMNRAAEERSLELAWHIKADPRIDGLRSDARFLAITRQMGLPQ
ncbi:winged helix-turn-helix domain-containing tetratricopeptide repeat protein [Occallatibacter savannae]|uniref:winged helix-turn-helix domain-containing tetratricopeptide repeat protein n=1 Tax=Occallatibacter savannae TaxID=1002691 RepID=UPI000D69B8FE|nr:winged helix-turn-helix domain-containing protein [Occallatibacter savannae]